MNINVAFVKNETVWTCFVQVGYNNNYVFLEEGQICIVPVGVSVYSEGKRIASPVAGGIYTHEPVYVDLGVVLDDGTKVDFSNGQGVGFEWDSRTEEERENWPTLNEVENLISDCYWQWDDTEHHEGYYVFKVHDPNDAGKGTYNNHTPNQAYNTDKDNYIFLYANSSDPLTVWGDYMTKGSNDGSPLGLHIESSKVESEYYCGRGGLFMVRRSN